MEGSPQAGPRLSAQCASSVRQSPLRQSSSARNNVEYRSCAHKRSKIGKGRAQYISKCKCLLSPLFFFICNFFVVSHRRSQICALLAASRIVTTKRSRVLRVRSERTSLHKRIGAKLIVGHRQSLFCRDRRERALDRLAYRREISAAQLFAVKEAEIRPAVFFFFQRCCRYCSPSVR